MAMMFQGNGSPLTRAGVDAALAALGPQAGEAALWSILAVETRGFGYLPDKRLKILFERHIFHKRTGGQFSASHPDISNPVAGGYRGNAAEYDRLARAMALDRAAALESASWGLGQVMGFNARSLGYADAEAMVTDFISGEDAQLMGCAQFITNNRALQRAYVSGDWKRVAFYYNGESYAKNRYDAKLSSAYAACVQGLPDVAIRTGQARLVYAGYRPGQIDGRLGLTTKKAIRDFQAEANLEPTEEFDAPTVAALRAAAGF